MAITKIGTPELFDFSSLNTALQLPTGPTSGTGGRPSNPSTGEWRYNTTLKYVEYWDGIAWFKIDTEATENNDFPSENFNVNTYFGNGGTQTIDAKFNEAANFNGSSSYIEISQTLLGSGTLKTWSTSFWFKSSSSTEQYLNNTAAAGNNSGYGVYIKSSGYLIFTTSSGGGGISEKGLEYQTDLSDGDWHNVVATYTSAGGTNDATLKLYVDGADVTSSSVAVNGYVAGSGSTYNSFTIPRIVLGRWADTGSTTALLEGAMDQVRFFNTTLTDAQAIDCFTDETTTTAATLNFPAGAGCIAAYQLDGDASDLSGTYGGAETDIGYSGLKFAPDMIWIKVRNASVSSDHQLFDTVRGPATNLSILYPNYNGAEDPGGSAYLADTLSNGFTVGSSVYVGGSGRNYVAWCFKGGGAPDTDNSGGSSPTPGSIMVDGSAYTTTLTGTIIPKRATANTAAGFSIINYDGSGISNGTLNHFLSAAPELYIWKRISSTSDWSVAGKDINNYQGYLELNDSVDINVDSTMQAPTSSLIKFNTTSASYNGSGQEWMLYVFHSVAGYSRISTYTGDGNNPGPIVYTTNDGTATGTDGFEPAMIIIKRTDTAEDWKIIDNKRGFINSLEPNENIAEEPDNNSGFIAATNGFQINDTSGDYNAVGGTYLYLAIAANKNTSAPTVTNSFSPTLYTGTDAAQSIFTATQFGEMNWFKNTAGISHAIVDIVRSRAEYIFPDDNVVQASSASDKDLVSFNPNGFTLGPVSAAGSTNASSGSTMAWSWKAGGLPTIQNGGTITSIVSSNQAAGFSIVRYEGNGLSGATIPHNLGGTPELVLNKCVSDPKDWNVFNSSLTTNYLMKLNTSGAQFDGAAGTNGGAFTVDSTLLTVVGGLSTQNNNNASGESFIAYCFRSITGYVDVGSYTGVSTGTRTHVTGFEPSFVMIKSYDTAGQDWNMYDNKRRTPPSSILFANLPDAEYTIDNSGLYVTFVSGGAGVGGFTTSGVVSGIDGATRNFIYLAIK